VRDIHASSDDAASRRGKSVEARLLGPEGDGAHRKIFAVSPDLFHHEERGEYARNAVETSAAGDRVQVRADQVARFFFASRE
jgi:hypothetical protein